MTEAPLVEEGIDKRWLRDITREGVVVCSPSLGFLLHSDDVVESTTSRPLHTVGTTVAAEAAEETSHVFMFSCSERHFRRLTFRARKLAATAA